YAAYFIAACVLNFNRALALVVITCVVLFFLAYDLVVKFYGKTIKNFLKPVGRFLSKFKKWIKWAFAALVLIGLILWLALDTAKKPTHLISFGGVCMFVCFLFLMSKHHRAALPIVVFFSCVMSILYYIGIMQYAILKISWLMQVTMGTTATETLSVAGNIFVGQTEAPLLIRPYLPEMTKSEIHAVMTGGFGTIAGSVMGAYISFGIDPSSLIAASVMAAPCALALSKLVYPETEESKFKDEEGVKIEKGEERTILEAASNGASTSVGLVANIAANLIAFMALLEFINSAFSWIGGMVNYPKLTLQLILSYIFMPVAFMMGVRWDEAGPVGEMLGTKIILNEFVAYRRLADYKAKRLEGADEWLGDSRQWITERAEVITTFALCGFANISSIGIIYHGTSTEKRSIQGCGRLSLSSDDGGRFCVLYRNNLKGRLLFFPLDGVGKI
ncbi:hypothetical protein AB205_0079950, partial [Aquarana catesbeiana]